MLEDRDYMRQPEFREHPFRNFRWSWTVALIVAYAVVLIFQLAAFNFFPETRNYYGYFALSEAGLEHRYFWQLLTYQFMHAGWIHLLLNCWAIYVFGRELESVLGWKKYLSLVFSSGIIGGVFQVLTTVAWPQIFPDAPVVGASACAFGLVAAFAMLFPEREITLLLFFILPVRLTAKMLLLVSAAIAVFGVIFPTDNVANAAHIGGMLMGIFYARKIVQGNWFQWKSSQRRGAPRELAATYAGKKNFWRAVTAKTDEELSADEFLRREVDPILDKISAHGIQSLTERERQTLEKARSKMAKR
jgi:membrane associated rhomboid family serine protease